MEYTSLKFAKTVQVSQFEPETIEIQAQLSPKDDLQTCLNTLRKEVSTAFGVKGGAETVKTEKVSAPKQTTASTGDDVPKKKTLTKESVSEKSAKPAGKAAKKKTVAYNRDIKDHQTKLGKLLHSNFPGWKEDEELSARAKSLSGKFTQEEVEFMDSEGNVLESFVDTLNLIMSGGEAESEEEDEEL